MKSFAEGAVYKGMFFEVLPEVRLTTVNQHIHYQLALAQYLQNSFLVQKNR